VSHQPLAPFFLLEGLIFKKLTKIIYIHGIPWDVSIHVYIVASIISVLGAGGSRGGISFSCPSVIPLPGSEVAGGLLPPGLYKSSERQKWLGQVAVGGPV
jgi:hypothetical protein